MRDFALSNTVTRWRSVRIAPNLTLGFASAQLCWRSTDTRRRMLHNRIEMLSAAPLGAIDLLPVAIGVYVVVGLLVAGATLLMLRWPGSAGAFGRFITGRHRRRREEEEEPSPSVAVGCGAAPGMALRLGWQELLPHVHLQEYVRIDGVDLEDREFWLILLPTTMHNLHLVAYHCRQAFERARGGTLGVVSLKPGEWGAFQFDAKGNLTPGRSMRVSSGEPVWSAETVHGIALGNVVDYVRGNAFVVKAVARRLESTFIKQWDVPAEFAFAAAHAQGAISSEVAARAGEASQAEYARLSKVAEFASAAVEAHVAKVSEAGGQARARAGGAGPDGTRYEPPRLASGTVRVLQKGRASALEFCLDAPVCLRVFDVRENDGGGVGPGDTLDRRVLRESLMHMRIRRLEPKAGEASDHPIVVYRDVASNEVKSQDLCERNVVGVAKIEDGRFLDAVKVGEHPFENDPLGRNVVRVENLGESSGLGVAVWATDPLTPALSVGGQVGSGRYRLVRLLGAGGMGVVWLAEDTRLKEQVALKFLAPEVRADPVALDDLRRETVRSHRLSHPNIIRIHDLVESPSEPPLISMEYVEGPTLTQLRLQQPQHVLTWDFLRPIVQEICQALDYAHGEKVVHRDVKPSNLMLTKKGRVKLADFGIAVSVSDSRSSSFQQHRLSGTLSYMSPQQMEGERPCASDDLYALGASLYDLLTSRPPFFSGDIIYQAQTVPAKPLAERLAELGLRNPVPEHVAATILACLAKDTAARPQSAREVAERLGLAFDGRPLGGVAASGLSGEEVGRATAGDPSGRPSGGMDQTSPRPFWRRWARAMFGGDERADRPK